MYVVLKTETSNSTRNPCAIKKLFSPDVNMLCQIVEQIPALLKSYRTCSWCSTYTHIQISNAPFSIWHCRVNRNCKATHFPYKTFLKKILNISNFITLNDFLTSHAIWRYVIYVSQNCLTCSKLGCYLLEIKMWNVKNTKI